MAEGAAVAIDGKARRGMHGDRLPGVHWVAAYAPQGGIVVGPQAVGEQKNELDAVAGLLGQWDLEGLVVTGDAQFTQREVCPRIVAQGGSWLKGELLLRGKGEPAHPVAGPHGHWGCGTSRATTGSPDRPARWSSGTAAVVGR